MTSCKCLFIALVIAATAPNTWSGESRIITVFSSEEGDFDPDMNIDNQVVETVFKDDVQKDIAHYAGTYASSRETGDDHGWNRSITISVNKGKVSAVYWVKSWTYGPQEPADEKPMTQVSISKNIFSGDQDLVGRSTIYGRFVTGVIDGKKVVGLLDQSEDILWTKWIHP